MKVRAIMLAWGLLAVGLGVPGQPTMAEEVRVYTNADLEDLPPVPASTTGDQPVQQAQPDQRQNWQFVTDFIEREHARLDRERQRRDAAAADAAAAAYDREWQRASRWRGYLPLNRFLGYYHRPGPKRPHHGRPYRPLSRAQVAFQRANRNRGVDAFPN